MRSKYAHKRCQLRRVRSKAAVRSGLRRWVRLSSGRKITGVTTGYKIQHNEKFVTTVRWSPSHCYNLLPSSRRQILGYGLTQRFYVLPYPQGNSSNTEQKLISLTIKDTVRHHAEKNKRLIHIYGPMWLDIVDNAGIAWIIPLLENWLKNEMKRMTHIYIC